MTKRPLCVAAVGVAAGIVMAEYFSGREICALMPVMAVLWIVFMFRCVRRKRRRLGMLLFPLWVLAGTGCMYRAQSNVPKIPADHKDTVILRGTVTGRQSRADKTIYYIQDAVFLEKGEASGYSVCIDDAGSYYQGTCMAGYEGSDTIAIGSTICFSGTISLFEHATNPGQFDALDYYRAQGIDFSIFQMEILGNDQNVNICREKLCQVREYLHGRLDKLAGRHAGILQAMLLGEKSSMDEEIKSLYQRNGISHILVISGLHFSMIGMCLYRMLRRAGDSFVLAGAASTAVLLIYGVMTGFGVSAVRAFIMFAAGIGAQMLGVSYDFPSALGGAAAFILVRNPYMLFQAGFLLSVGAVLSIMLVVPVFEMRGSKRKPVKRDMGWRNCAKVRLHNALMSALQGMLSGAGIQAGTIPVLLYFFYECAPGSVLLNCMVLPLLPVVILGTIAAVVAGLVFPSIAGVLVLPSLWVLDVYEMLCRIFGKLPLSQLVTGRPEVWRLVVYYSLLAAVVWLHHVCTGRNKESRGVRRLILRGREHLVEMKCRIQERSPAGERICAAGVKIAGVLLYLGLCWVLFLWRDTGDFAFTMLDVGQGQSVYIKSDGENLLYDGGSTDVSQVGKYRIVPFLKASGVGSLDAVIVSHMDADHYNGITQILEEELMDIKCLMLPRLPKPDEAYEKLCALADRKGVRIQYLARGDQFETGETVCTVWHPAQDYTAADRNDASLVIQMTHGEFSLLLTGDVEQEGEEQMLSGRMAEQVTVLQAAHHGSASSSSQEFLEQTAPELVLISCGRNNRYGHPAPETMEKLAAMGCEVHMTMEEGSISCRAE